MELRHLRYFVAVADAGSLTVAAEQKDVGTQLVGRSAQGVELTSAGKAFRHAWHWSRRKPPRKRPCTQLIRPNRHSLSASCRVRTILLILVSPATIILRRMWQYRRERSRTKPSVFHPGLRQLPVEPFWSISAGWRRSQADI